MTTRHIDRGAARPNIRRRIFDILQPNRDGDGACRAFDIFIVALILLNVVAVALETIPGWSAA